MSTPFLQAFSQLVVSRLLSDGKLEVRAGSEAEVVRWLADYLAGPAQGFSLISSVSKALVNCPDVEELFADDDEIKGLVDSLGPHGR